MSRALLLACGAALLAALPATAQPAFQIADPVITTVTSALHQVAEETRHAVVLIDASANGVLLILPEAKVGNIVTLKRIDESANSAVVATAIGVSVDGITSTIGVPAGANATLIHAGDGEWFVIEGRILDP